MPARADRWITRRPGSASNSQPSGFMPLQAEVRYPNTLLVRGACIPHASCPLLPLARLNAQRPCHACSAQELCALTRDVMFLGRRLTPRQASLARGFERSCACARGVAVGSSGGTEQPKVIVSEPLAIGGRAVEPRAIARAACVACRMRSSSRATRGPEPLLLSRAREETSASGATLASVSQAKR